MKHLSIFIIFISLCIFSFAQDGEMTKKQAKKLFKKKEWLGGWDVKPSKSINYVEFAKQYHRNKKYWDEAFAFLKNQDLQKMPKGKHVINGDNVFASFTFDSTKNYDKTSWESHKKYIDIQYVIDGEEKIGVFPASNATITNQYDEKRDIMNYSANGKLYTATPKTFFIFFPTDAHRPNITPGGNMPDRKVVIKMIYAN